jgi:transmembrane sensor
MVSGMSSAQSTLDDIPAGVIDAAIDWTVKLDFNSATADTRQAFEHWLQAAPLHGEAWRRMQRVRQDFAGVPPLLALDTLQAATGIRRKTASLQRRQLLKLLGLSAATVTIGWQGHDAVPWQRFNADVSTAVGEQRRLPLGDGALVALNTDTAIDRDSAAMPQWIRLRRGELFIATGDTPGPMNVPLRLHTPFGDIEASAAQFVVRLEAERARISVRAGQLRLRPGYTGIDPVFASSGESWWLGSGAVRPAASLRFDAAGWLDGVIAARDMRLADFLAELARYRHGRISCDPRVADVPVSGVYHIRDTDRALQLLAQTQSLELSFRTRFRVAVGPASARAT